MAQIDDSYCQYIEGTHPFLCWWIPQQYLTLWTLAHVRDVSGSKENINIIWFIFGFVICVLTVGKVCNFLCALQFWFSDHPARIKYGSFPTAPSQTCLPNGSQRLFSKRMCTSKFNPCLQQDIQLWSVEPWVCCCIPWHTHEFHLTFNQYFQIALIPVLPQFSHLLTIHSVHRLVWTRSVCWLGLHYGLHLIFPFRRKWETDRKICLPFPNPSLGWEEMFSWMKNNLMKFSLRNTEMRRKALETSHW